MESDAESPGYDEEYTGSQHNGHTSHTTTPQRCPFPFRRIRRGALSALACLPYALGSCPVEHTLGRPRVGMDGHHDALRASAAQVLLHPNDLDLEACFHLVLSLEKTIYSIKCPRMKVPLPTRCAHLRLNILEYVKPATQPVLPSNLLLTGLPSAEFADHRSSPKA